MLRFYVLLVILSLVGCMSGLSTSKSVEPWYFVPTNSNDILFMTSLPAREDGKLLGGSLCISLLCKYGVGSISNECITSFMFIRRPNEYGGFPKSFGPIPLKIEFSREGVDSLVHINFFALEQNWLMVYPDQVDQFLSILTSSDKLSFHLEWRNEQATYDKDYHSIFTFNLSKTTIALDRFKSKVISKSPNNRPHKSKTVRELAQEYDNHI